MSATDLRRQVDLSPVGRPKPRPRVDFTPMSMINRPGDYHGLPCMVICRAPADDGWLILESETHLIYNLFDTVAHLYQERERSANGKMTVPSEFRGPGLVASLSDAEWYFRPKHAEFVGVKRASPRKAAA